MMIFNTFFALLFVFATPLKARHAAPSLEDSKTMKSIKRLGQSHQKMDRPPKGKRAGGASSTQGQASSSAYSREDFTIQIDIAAEEHSDTSTGQKEAGDIANHKDPAQHKYSMASGFSAKPISAIALNIAKAKHELKKKLQTDNKKPFQLQEVSGEKKPKDPREEIITELMKASEDIKK